MAERRAVDCIECGDCDADHSLLCEPCKPLYADNDNRSVVDPGRADEVKGDNS